MVDQRTMLRVNLGSVFKILSVSLLVRAQQLVLR